MTRPAGTYRIPPPAPPQDGAGPAPSGERAPLCTHCGAIGTHYLTCASLRLPAGYRLEADLAPTAGCRFEAGPEPATGRLASGPHHPDWPLPPGPAPLPPAVS